jgi:hypothetical protein
MIQKNRVISGTLFSILRPKDERARVSVSVLMPPASAPQPCEFLTAFAPQAADARRRGVVVAGAWLVVLAPSCLKERVVIPVVATSGTAARTISLRMPSTPTSTSLSGWVIVPIVCLAFGSLADATSGLRALDERAAATRR